MIEDFVGGVLEAAIYIAVILVPFLWLRRRP
jgi:hypothetical protein